MPHPKFIAAEAFGKRGEVGERIVWEAIKRVFTPRECVVYWRYPIFSQTGKARQEPDILIVDRELGLIVIEVKSIAIEQIVNIIGHCWQLQNFYIRTIRPYEQAENQLISLLEFCDREPSLRQQVAARALVSLPQISESQWQKRKFHELPSCPSILFVEHLNNSIILLRAILETPPLIKTKILSREQWKLLLTRLGGAPIFQRYVREKKERLPTNLGSYSQAIAEVNKQLLAFSNLTESNFKLIPSGFQRIRGLPGSGKTTLLCQKAAYMHLEHPDWDIALVFFSRSRYQNITEQLNYWLDRLSHGEIQYTPDNYKLKVLHAWGGKERPGFYSTICQAFNIQPLKVDTNQKRLPQEDLALACRDVLKTSSVESIFDAILVDDAADLLVKNEFKFEDKQPFFALAERALRTAIEGNLESKRLIWSDALFSNYESGKTPSASELFGDRCGQLVSGNCDGGIPKTLFLDKCYRTPEPIIALAYAIAMGLIRPVGALSGAVSLQDWMAIGYQIQGNFLERLPATSLHPIQELWQKPLLEFNNYPTRQAELNALSTNILRDINSEGIAPSRQILVIILGTYFDAAKLEIDAANFLIAKGIDIFIPGSNAPNNLETGSERRDPNKFWHPGAVTISRVRRACGNEAELVYILGCDAIAKQESFLNLRYQLFAALTRSKASVKLSGVGDYRFYREIRQLIDYRGKFPLPKHRLQHYFHATEIGEILQRYAMGDRNFAGIDLRGMHLAGINLEGANLIGAMLNGANLSRARLDGAKLVIADLTAANLTGTSLKKAKLIGSILDRTNLTGADLSYADLTDVDLESVELSKAKLVGTRFN